MAVPFFLTARAMGIPTVFMEVYDRVESPTLTGRLLQPIATKTLVQWPEQRAFYPRAVCVGSLR